MQNSFAEHVIFSFPENIISRFDVAVNDVAKEFAEKLHISLLGTNPHYSAIILDFCQIL